MKLGMVDASIPKGWCFLCKESFSGADAKDDLLKHLNLDHHRVLMTAEDRRGKTYIHGGRQGWTGDLPPFVFKR
jgi:hypothetical protein